MFDMDFLIKQYLNNTEPESKNLFECFKAYQFLVDKFGFEPVIQPGRVEVLGWDIEYLCGANLAGQIEATLIRRQNDFVPENDHPLILDCGANVGITVLNYKRQFPKARVIAFEADPEIVPILRRNLDRNRVGDVEVVDAAVWTGNGSASWQMEGIDGSHLGAGDGSTGKTVTVRTIDLRDYLDASVDLLKMDIEGAEYEVITHADEKLKNVKAISLECHVDQKTVISFGGILRTLSELGFKVSVAGSVGPWRDLVRQPPVREDHHESYLLVSAWREAMSSVNVHSSWLPGAGIAPILEFANQAQYILRQVSGLIRYLNNCALDVDSKRSLKRRVLKGPYVLEIGLCWVVPLKDLVSMADHDDAPHRSVLLLYENDKVLLPAHTPHDDIRSLGGGRYSHWAETLYFSTSDGSDPNTNGCKYQIMYMI
jgi:FkbM family methyltransferase